MDTTDIREPLPGGPAGPPGYGPITDTMVDHLRGTRPWVLFISILGFMAAGLMVLVGVVVGVGSAFVAGLSEGLGVVGGMAMGFFYILFALVYVAMSAYLYRYASAIRVFSTTGESRAMEEALGSQRAFWKVVGIIAVAYLVLVVLGVLVALVVGLLVGLSG